MAGNPGQRWRQLGVNEEAHAAALRFGQHEYRMISSLRRIFQAGANVLGLQVRKVRKDFTLRHPAASKSSTSLTRMRMPRMQGRPPHCLGLKVIRSACFIRE